MGSYRGSDRHCSDYTMQEHDHMCNHPGCYKTENQCTIYEVESRRSEGSFKVCGAHLMRRDIDRAEARVTAASDIINRSVLNALRGIDE